MLAVDAIIVVLLVDEVNNREDGIEILLRVMVILHDLMLVTVGREEGKIVIKGVNVLEGSEIESTIKVVLIND